MTFKHINLNLYEGGLFFDAILDFFEKEKPDVVALQEVFNGTDPTLEENFRSMEVLKDFFRGWDYFYAPEFMLVRPEGKLEIGNAIFSRFPITHKKVTDFGIPYGEFDAFPPQGDFGRHPKNIQCCDVHCEGTTFTICNTHGIWGLDGADTPERLEMSRRIVEMIKDRRNLLISGDFNIKPNTQTITNIEKYLKNVYKNDLTSSFNLKHKDLEKHPGYASAVVDMLFVSPDVSVTTQKVATDDVSDHLAFVTEIEYSS